MSKSVAKAPRAGIGREKKRGISTILFRCFGAIRAFATDLDNLRPRGPLEKVIQGAVLKEYSASAAVMVCSNVSRGRR